MTSHRHSICLDSLEIELRQRIAAYLCRPSQPNDALSLAETNPCQRDAVLNALSCTIRITPDNFDQLPRWAVVAIDHVRTLSFCAEQTSSSPIHLLPSIAPYFSSLFCLFRAHNLRRVEIYDETTMLTALHDSPTVQELLVRIEGLAPVGLLQQVIQSLPLRCLEVECYQTTADCPIQDLHFSSSDLVFHHEPVSLHPLHQTWSRDLQSLRINCNDPQHPDYLADFIPLFPNLVEATVGNIGRPFHDPYPLHLLKRLTSVRIIHARKGFKLALKLSHRVTALHISQKALTSSDLNQLSVCCNIRDLYVHIFYGTDEALSNRLSKLRQLTTLKLYWEKPNRSRSFPLMNGFPSRPQAAVSLRDGFFSTALTEDKTPSLKELRLEGVISCKELDDILRNMGRRLHVFVVSVCEQLEAPLIRVAHVLTSLASHCPELRMFNTTDDLSTLREDNNPGLRNWAQQVLSLLRALEQRAPFLDTERFEISVNRMISQNDRRQPVITPVQSRDIDREREQNGDNSHGLQLTAM